MKTKYDSWARWWDFTLALTGREIKGRYKHAFLGFLWMVANPLLQMLVIGLVLQFFPDIRTENYFLYLFTGLLPWNFFSVSFSKAVSLFVDERHLVKKARFPRESLILSLTLSNLFHFAIGLVLIFPFAFMNIQPLLLLVAVLWLAVFTTGISLLFSSLNVKYRDISFFVRAVIPLWFYATPLIYSLRMVPEKVQALLFLNPLTAIMHLFRASFGIHEGSVAPSAFAQSLVLTAIVICIGVLVFKKEERYFDDWM